MTHKRKKIESEQMNTKEQLSLYGSSNTHSLPQPSENELALLALDAIPGVGFATVRALFDIYKGQLSQVWTASGDSSRARLGYTRNWWSESVVRTNARRRKHSKLSARISRSTRL